MALGLLLTGVMLFMGTYYYLVTHSHFELGTSSSISRSVIEDSEPIYLGFHFYFKGYGTATIENINVVHPDGTIIQPNHAQILVTPFIDTTGTIGVMEERDVFTKSITKAILPVQNHAIKNHQNVAFKVELKDKDFNQNFNFIIV